METVTTVFFIKSVLQQEGCARGILAAGWHAPSHAHTIEDAKKRWVSMIKRLLYCGGRRSFGSIARPHGRAGLPETLIERVRMSDNRDTQSQVKQHYSVTASTYRNYYDPAQHDLSPTYPAEYFRLNLLLDRLKETSAKRVLDARCEGTPLMWVAELGAEICGFDFTPEMIEEARDIFSAQGLNPDWVIVGDVQNFDSFSALMEDQPFDCGVFPGVMPHVNDELKAGRIPYRSPRKNGRAFVEFRNELFNLITMNRFTHNYIVEELFAKAPPSMGSDVSAFDPILAMDKPPLRTEAEGKPGYDAIQARMHNPLEMDELFGEAGFTDVKIHWYHWSNLLPREMAWMRPNFVKPHLLWKRIRKTGAATFSFGFYCRGRRRLNAMNSMTDGTRMLELSSGALAAPPHA